LGQGSDCNPHTNRRRSAQVAGRLLVHFSDIANIEQMFYYKNTTTQDGKRHEMLIIVRIWYIIKTKCGVKKAGLCGGKYGEKED